MKKTLIWVSVLFVSCFGCKKDDAPSDQYTEYAPVPVTKTVSKRIFVHVMPWFESPATNNGVWGSHWRMNNKNPNNILSNGQRDIASKYYPLTGPYASGDANIVEYQLLLMKLSGIDGVLIDWPGTQQVFDYPRNVKNAEKMIALLEKAGMNFGIVYEDQNLPAANPVPQAQTDMTYMQANYFSKANYEKIGGKPLLMVFGPQRITNNSGWSSAFSVLSTPPAFFTLWGQSGEAPETGEFAWINQDHMTSLNNFYANGYTGVKFGSAYPGFNSFYAEGGWSGPTWVIPHDNGGGPTSTFNQTLDLALSKPAINYVQLNTWNDYGEGTIIEPTKEFGYGFLTSLQQKLGITLTQADLEAVAQLYQLRLDKAGDAAVQKKLDQAFYYIVSLQMTKAKDLLNSL